MSREIYKTLGKRIKAFRNSLGISQRKFASRISISNNYLSDIETGKANPTYDFFLRLIEEYKINLEYIFKGQGEMTISTSEDTVKKPITKEILDSGGKITIEQLYWLIDHCAGLNYSILALASEYIFKNKEMILAALAYSEKSSTGTKPPS